MNPTIEQVVKFGKMYLGIICKKVATYDSYTWRMLAVHYEPGIIYYPPHGMFRKQNIIHEYGHYFAATKKQRGLTNWGLSIYSVGSNSERDQKKEALACKYEIGFMRIIGFNMLAIRKRADFLNCNEHIRKLPQIIDDMKKRRPFSVFPGR